MRTLAPFGRRLARVAAVERIGEYALLWADDADGPRRSAPGPVLHAGRRGALGGGGGRAALAPARVLLLPRRGRPARVHPRGRRAGHAPARASSQPGDGLWLTGPARHRLHAARTGAPAARGRRHRRGADSLLERRARPRTRASCSASAPPATPRRRRSSAARPRSRPTTAPPAARAYVTELLREELDADAGGDGLRVRPAADARGRARAVRRARRAARSSRWSRAWRAASARASAASCPTRNGYVRLCVDGPGRRRGRARDGARRRERALTAGRGIELCGVALRGPVLNGSGTFDAIAARRTFGDELLERFPFDAFVSKTITLAPRQGNPPPRLWETPAGLINSIGLPNKGLEGFLASDLPQLAELPVPLVVSVMGFSRDELAELVGAGRGARRGRDDRAERLVPERRDRARHGRRPARRPRARSSARGRSPRSR